jgi:hypothetical protein
MNVIDILSFTRNPWGCQTKPESYAHLLPEVPDSRQFPLLLRN